MSEGPREGGLLGWSCGWFHVFSNGALARLSEKSVSRMREKCRRRVSRRCVCGYGVSAVRVG